MKRPPQFLQPRQSVIYGYTLRMIRETGTNRRSFAMELADQYLALTAMDELEVPFRITRGGTDSDVDKKHNGQILGRYLDGQVKTMPANLEDAWVMSLPEPYRSDCERDLARRRGMLSVRLPDCGEAGQTAALATLVQDFGELMSVLAPALADGRIDGEDRLHARKILNKSDDLISAVLAHRRPVQMLLDDGVVGA